MKREKTDGRDADGQFGERVADMHVLDRVSTVSDRRFVRPPTRRTVFCFFLSGSQLSLGGSRFRLSGARLLSP